MAGPAAVSAAVGVGLWSWFVVGLAPFSGGATLAVLASGGGAALVGAALRRRSLSRRVGRSGPRRDAAASRGGGWVVLVAATGAWQLASFLQHPRDEHPTLSSLTNALLETQPTRAAAFLVWLLVTAELVRR